MKGILFIFLFVYAHCGFGQGGTWTWIHGDSTTNKPFNHGTKGVTSPLNLPPGRYEAAEWKDQQGNFWMFGGCSANGSFNDLWKYDPIMDLDPWHQPNQPAGNLWEQRCSLNNKLSGRKGIWMRHLG